MISLPSRLLGKLRFLVLALTIPVSFLHLSFAQEQIKIGTIDMGRVLSSYHRTVAFNEALRADARAAEIEVEEIRGSLRKLLEKRAELEKDINAPELVPERKQALRMEYQGLTAEITGLDRTMRETVGIKQRQLVNRRGQFMQQMFEVLSDTVEKVARREGFDLVLERSGRTQNNFPVVLYSGSAADFTDLIIAEVNKDAPEDFDPEAVQGGGMPQLPKEEAADAE